MTCNILLCSKSTPGSRYQPRLRLRTLFQTLAHHGTEALDQVPDPELETLFCLEDGFQRVKIQAAG